MPYILFFIHTIANPSDPSPFEHGSTTVKQAAVAMAASTAFPPCISILKPACVAKLFPVQTTPFRAITFIRLDANGFL